MGLRIWKELRVRVGRTSGESEISVDNLPVAEYFALPSRRGEPKDYASRNKNW